MLLDLSLWRENVCESTNYTDFQASLLKCYWLIEVLKSSYETERLPLRYKYVLNKQDFCYFLFTRNPVKKWTISSVKIR